MKTFSTILTEISEEERTNVIEKTVKVGRNPKTTFTFTRTTEGILGIEYGDKGNVVFGNIIRKQIIDLLQGK
jgi:hypothetical protein